MLDLSSFSTAAQAAITAPDGPLLIVAGPGAGKTTVLAARIAHLVLDREIPPPSILALAFTTDAARTLKARLRGLLGHDAEDLDAGTFHAWGLRVVRSWAGELGYRAHPLVVYGDSDARGLLKTAAESLGWEMPAEIQPAMLEAMERARVAMPLTTSSDHAALRPLVEAYEALLLRRGAVDYAAMLALPLRLFSERPRAVGFYQHAYAHVLVDEFQDLCPAEYGLIQLLCEQHRNVTVVGDPRQVLYRFRGADVRFLLNFSDAYPGARVVQLTHNLRSTPELVALGNAVGHHLGYGHPMQTDNPPGGPASVYAAPDEWAEAGFVASQIRRLLDRGQIQHPGEVAVLYRTRHQAGPLLTALREQNLPYRVRGHADLFARREVRDLLAYLRLAHSPADAAALARVVNVPPRRLATLAKSLPERPLPLDALPPLAAVHGPRAAASAQALVDTIQALHAAAMQLRPAALLDRVLADTGYLEWLKQQPDGADRVGHIEAFRTVAARAESDLGSWLADLHLDQEVDPTGNDQRVLLSTIHASKGMEWPVVFLIGVEEGLLPHARAVASVEDREDLTAGLEDERRVFFVGLTRPRHAVTLSYCRQRTADDRVRVRRPSRFLDDLPPELVVRAA